MTVTTADRGTEEVPVADIARIVLVSPVRLYREGLAHVLADQPSIDVVGAEARSTDAEQWLTSHEVDIVLFDLAVEGGLAAMRRLGQSTEAKIVVLGLGDDDGPILECARVGIAGYVTQDSSIPDLIARIREAAADEFTCSPRLAAVLLRNLASSAPWQATSSSVRLTSREQQIVELIERGLSNKEIARRLTIQLATVKNHVHNILEKLSVRHRADAVRVARSLDSYPHQKV